MERKTLNPIFPHILLIFFLMTETGLLYAEKYYNTESISFSGDSIATEKQLEQTDTISFYTKELNEVVVKGIKVVKTGNTIKLFPSKRDKGFASGGMDVLANMNLPEVTVNPLSGEAVSSDGETMTFFIDFQPASMQQLRDIRPQDIQRIDIIRSPQDPRFQHARIVANYIMKKYEYGGYTKLDGMQFAPFSDGKYGLYSKFSYKNMTYDMSAGLAYSRHGNRSGSENHSIYRFYSGELERDYMSDSYRSRKISPRVSGRIMYSTTSVSIANMVGFNYSRRNPFESGGRVVFSDIFESSKNFTTSSIYNKSAIWNGNYNFHIRHDISLNFNGQFNWSKNIDNSRYTLSGYTPIINEITEQIINTYAGLTLSKRLGNHNLSIFGSGGWTRNKLDYISSSNTGVYYREGYGQIGTGINIVFNKFSINPSVRLSLSAEKINEITYTRWLPKVFVPFYLQCTKKSSVNGSFEFAMGGPSASLRSPVLVRSNEIDAIRGNENLSNYNFYNARLGYSHHFGSWLSSRIDIGLKCEDNILVPVYNAISSVPERPMMVRDVVNDGAIYNTSLSASLSGNYFDNKLSVRVLGAIHYFAQRGYNSRDKWSPSCWINASYFIRNVKLNAYFSPSLKQYSAWYDTKTPLFWYIGVSWAYNDLFIDLRCSNPFRKSYVSRWKTIDGANYLQREISHSPAYHQCIRLNISYSIGYGKKMSRKDEVGKLKGSQSIILK